MAIGVSYAAHGSNTAISARCRRMRDRCRIMAVVAIGGNSGHCAGSPKFGSNVKVCGWRPHDGGAAHTGAGVRKPPREETAGGVRRPRVRRYGEFGAGGV